MTTESFFGQLLRQYRKALDWTQAQLAAYAHCSVDTLRKIERGKLRPSSYLAAALADALHLPPEKRQEFIASARGLPRTGTTTTPHNLPVISNVFTGREAEITQLQHDLQDPQRRLMTITGLGGVGKTRLAVEVARRVLADFPDGVYFVPLAPVDSGKFLISAIAKVLNINLFNTVDPQSQLINHLKSRSLLLVLDNFEQLLNSLEDYVLQDILAEAPNVKLLVTSRERLHLHSEWLFELHGLAYPQENSDLIQPYPAVELFFQRAVQINPQFSLNDNVRIVAEICRRLHGLPLAIEMAVSWLRVMSYSQILEAITRDQALLITQTREMPARHRSLRAVFDHSWRLLTDEERRCLLPLAVFRGGFALEAAQAVADITPFILRQLVDKSLVRRNADDDYELHELLRQYLETHWSATEAEVVRDRHLQYYMEMVEKTSPLLEDDHNAVTMQRLERAFPNIRAALEWSLTSASRTLKGLSIIGAIYWYWQLGHVVEGQYWHESILARVPPETVTVEMARALHGASAMAFLQGNLALSEQRSQRSIHISRTINDINGLSNSVMGYGFILETRGEVEQAERAYQEVSLLLQQVGKPYLAVATFSRRCSLAISRGDIQQAEALIEQIAQLDPDGNVWAAGFLAFARGEKELFRGRYEAALHDLEQAAHDWQRIRDKLTIFLPRRRLAEALAQSGQLEAARQTYLDIYEQWKEVSNIVGMAAACCDLAHVLALMKRGDEAISYIHRGLELYRDADFEAGLSCALIKAAELYCQQGKPEQAAHFLGAAAVSPSVKHLSLYLPTWVDRDNTIECIDALSGE